MSDAVAAIRAATSADAAGVTRIVEDAYRHYIARIGRRPAPMLNDYGELISRDAVWVMEERGSIVGIVVLLPMPDHLLLDNIAVSPQRQGVGSGRKLLAFAETEAINQGYSEIRLYTHVKMVENQRLYASIGYEQTEIRSEQGFERVFMRKRLLDDPATIVRKQLDAYNTRDIEAFMACWADDAEIFEHPSLLLASGAAEIRERHIARFKEPDLHGHLVHRMVAGNKGTNLFAERILRASRPELNSGLTAGSRDFLRPVAAHARRTARASSARNIPSPRAHSRPENAGLLEPPVQGSRTYPQRSLLPRHPAANAYTTDLGGYSVGVWAMRCTACGAEVILTNVVADPAMVRGLERHTFICLACHAAAHRVVFTRHGREDDSEPMPVHEAPPTVPAKIREDQSAAPRLISRVIARIRGHY